MRGFSLRIERKWPLANKKRRTEPNYGPRYRERTALRYRRGDMLQRAATSDDDSAVMTAR